MRFKNAKYSFCCNKDVREEFKMYCKISGISPSDILQAVMIEFNENAKKISNMKDISEVRGLLQEKMDYVTDELQKAEEHPTFQK